MKNILSLAVMLLLSNIGISQTFNDLDAIKSKNKSQIEQLLKKHNYTFLSNQTSSYQWQSKDKNEIIQFNGKGVLVILTYNQSLYKKMIVDLKKSKYKYSGKSIKNNTPVESYLKGKETIFLTSMKNPENTKQVYSITFI